jgi:glycerol-3-phosphate dehydrogenase
MTHSASARRAAALEKFASRPFDLLIVGGGATGAATARDAALRGLAVGLCDAGDFAGQTSGQSSKLIHGGLRYLQYGDLHLVFEGLAERRRLMRTAPHLCRPLEFVFPGYRGEHPGLVTLGAGIALYNALALWRPPAGSRHIAARAMCELAPHLRSAGLVGGQAYVDCQTDDARLVLENVLDAAAAGATVANHLSAQSLLRDRRGRVRGVTLADRETGIRLDAQARLVVNATGPFTDSFAGGGAPPRLRPTLGVHLVFEAARVPHHGRALVLRSPRDNRLFFVLPAGPRTIVGTTDTDWAPVENGVARGRPPRIGDDIRARGQDVAYLLEAVNHAFPPLRLGPDDVVSTYAALRPLLSAPAHTPSETSREHEIVLGRDGILTVTGGKLTTLRRMAEEAVDRAVDGLRAAGFDGAIKPCTTRQRPLPGGAARPAKVDGRMGAGVAERIEGAYGARAQEVLRIIGEAPVLAARIDPQLPYLWAEVVQAVRHEHARDLADVLSRRIPLFRDARDQGVAAADRAAALVGQELGWSAARRAQAVAEYRGLVERSRRWRAEI